MRHLELHIIQSVPVACLNRDDLNSPKTALFGGVQRARVSSQSWKRAIREYAKEKAPSYFKGERTRLLYDPLYNAMIDNGLSEEDADIGAKALIDYLVKIDEKSKDRVKSTTLYFLSPLEIATLSKEYAKTKDPKKAAKSINAEALCDAADISLFGRMVANDPSLKVEGAAMFSHALSTHKADNEIDFFAAVDDLQSDEEAGAGMTSTQEFNSATYYRFMAINLDMLADSCHLAALSVDERKLVVRTFIEATIMAMPGARKNAMNANTLPAYVLGIVRSNGHPIQLVNAFEKPVWSKEGYLAKSIQALKEEYARQKDIWGIKDIYTKAIPEVSLQQFLDEVVSYVI
ncbi:MAG TPA: type I-E CRISPR-associated protein Cas7/Cse4/CasC [Rectinema sp.]|jgi:CRISPR system Cascade subunit CasC|nr:type I-E CRISPR-associated protein Cas7/Cse4/CasC [Rectinema sp.]HOO02550.1 type I-E CRISPR-associated protein Cas7/Cse4/CasC [Rectinema sp.]HPW02057.1 type I-E CRISPR-associated protein Cas7/Cse4/CasC [Rectinema sp.]HPW46912.1 type I-E CRISPR-associated protein Cas7/Cse4/CasC [Rectinema sp.]HQN03459.1 type I-E CRISPR-associated protein Cas7/Cse4/CasC [Rectinema sp.]